MDTGTHSITAEILATVRRGELRPTADIHSVYVRTANEDIYAGVCGYSEMEGALVREGLKPPGP